MDGKEGWSACVWVEGNKGACVWDVEKKQVGILADHSMADVTKMALTWSFRAGTVSGSYILGRAFPLTPLFSGRYPRADRWLVPWAV